MSQKRRFHGKEIVKGKGGFQQETDTIPSTGEMEKADVDPISSGDTPFIQGADEIDEGGDVAESNIGTPGGHQRPSAPEAAIASPAKQEQSWAQALRDVALSMAEGCRFEEAIAVARSIPHRSEARNTLVDIAASMAKAGAEGAIPLFGEAAAMVNPNEAKLEEPRKG